MSVKEVVPMTKEEAINHVREVFKGNDTFISHCIIMIASTSNLKGISNKEIQLDSYYWEKLLSLTIDFGSYGFKKITYRKGNDRKPLIGRTVSTANIHDYTIINYENGESEEFSWNA